MEVRGVLVIGLFYAARPLDKDLVAEELDVRAEQVGGCGEERLTRCVVAERTDRTGTGR